jgi:hypothetical protein
VLTTLARAGRGIQASRLEDLRHHIMMTHYLSKDPVNLALNRDVISLDGKTVLVTEGENQFIMTIVVVAKPGSNPKVCRIMLLDASVSLSDSWSSRDCIPPFDSRKVAIEYLTVEGLALMQPIQKHLTFGVAYSLSLPTV